MKSNATTKARRHEDNTGFSPCLRVFVVALSFVVVVATPRAALACPVCFGQSDSPLASAMNLGILAMLGVVGAVLAAFAWFFIYLMRRARLVARQSEGTAQC